MVPFTQILIATAILVFGVLIGNVLRNKTKDEQKQGRKWFILLTFIGITGGIIGLILKNDIILFTFFFIAIVTSRSLIVKK